MDYKNGFTFICDRYSMRFVSRNISLYNILQRHISNDKKNKK